MRRIWECLKALQSIGIYPDLPYLEGKKIQMLNLIVLFCIPLTFFFTCTNLVGVRPFLAFINACSFISSLSTLILHHYRYYKAARSTLIIFNLIFFTMGGYYFHNGAEYLLLCLLIVTLLVYDNIYIQILASCATILAIILVIFYPSDFFSDNYVPVQRVMFNFVSAISFLLIIIAVFKDIQYTYQKKDCRTACATETDKRHDGKYFLHHSTRYKRTANFGLRHVIAIRKKYHYLTNCSRKCFSYKAANNPIK